MKRKRLTFIVPREGFDNDVCAIVSADETPEIKTESQLRNAITAAVTVWMKDCPTGKEAWEYAADDFNLGDLVGYLDGTDLKNLLDAQGVDNLDIIIDNQAQEWNYDTPLTNYQEED